MGKQNQPTDLDPDQAKLIVAQERVQRVEKCKEEIEAALQKHKCRFEVMVILKAGQVVPQIDIVPVE